MSRSRRRSVQETGPGRRWGVRETGGGGRGRRGRRGAAVLVRGAPEVGEARVFGAARGGGTVRGGTTLGALTHRPSRTTHGAHPGRPAGVTRRGAAGHGLAGTTGGGAFRRRLTRTTRGVAPVRLAGASRGAALAAGTAAVLHGVGHIRRTRVPSVPSHARRRRRRAAGAEDGRGGVLDRAGAPAAGGWCGRRGRVGPFPVEGARSGRGGGTEEPPTGPGPSGGTEPDAPGADGHVPGADAYAPGAAPSDRGSRDGRRGGAPCVTGFVVAASAVVASAVAVEVSWSGGMDGRGGAGGRGGMEARRASVLMHPRFLVPGRPGGRPGVRPPVGSDRHAYLGHTPPTVRQHHGQAIPVAADPHPRRGRPCVRVTLRAGPARTGTDPSARGFCPERPPTLR